MKLIENGKINFFDRIEINTELLKYLRLKELEKKEIDPDPINKMAKIEEETMDLILNGFKVSKVTNVKELFYKNYGEDAKELNIGISDYLKQLVTTRPSFVNDLSFRSNSKDKKSKFLTFFHNLLSNYKKKKEEVRTVDEILELFEGIKLELNKEINYVNRIGGLMKMLISAEKAGQESLKEKIFSRMIVDKYESILYASGYKKVISENQLLKLAEKLRYAKKKNLEITYLKNYTKPIPEEVIDKKTKADLLEVFDNYVVLYYGEKYEEPTKREREAMRDPILFGVIEGSRSLYYIADWIDEEDDLTWETIIETLSEEVDELELPEQIRIAVSSR